MISSQARHLVIIILSAALALESIILVDYGNFFRIIISLGVFWISWSILTLASGFILGLMGYDLRQKQSYQTHSTNQSASSFPGSKQSIRSSFPIGPYRLNMSIEELKKLREISEEEYGVVGRKFAGEKIFHAEPVELFGHVWKVMVGTLQGQVYKVAPYFVTQQKSDADKVAMAALTFCRDQLGNPSKQQTGLFIWDTTDGNVILQTAETAEGFGINLFVTSNAVRDFARL